MMDLLGNTINSDATSGIIGFEDPILDELLEHASGIVGDEASYKVAIEAARFIWDHVADGSLYGVDILWPLSTKVQGWDQRLEHGDRRHLTGTEYPKHR